MRKKNILITGGAGYIGSVLVPELLESGYYVKVIDNLMYKSDTLINSCAYSNFEFIDSDASDPEVLENHLNGIDVIIPLACYVGAPLSNKYPETAKKINFEAIKLLIDLKKDHQVIIYPTTNSGYGIGEIDKECTEESQLNPISLYGKTKVDSENLLLKKGNAITLRLATVFGISPRMRMDLLVNDFVYKALKDKALILFEEHFRRNYIHIKDVTMTFKYCIDNFELLKNNAYNVGLSSANLTKRELAEKIKFYIKDLVIISSEIGSDPDKRDYIVSNKKLENTGWKPNYTLDMGIIELIKLYKMIKTNNYSNI